MNFSQLHERLRFEVQRRIERGSLTAAELARRAGLQQPHISNFLRGKRRLSLAALDSVLRALDIEVADLLVEPERPAQHPQLGIPLISQDVAMHEERIRPAAVLERIMLPASLLANARTDRTARKPARDRFVAVTVTAQQAKPMDPVLRPRCIAVLDRHAALSKVAESSPGPVYAVNVQGELSFGYVGYDRNTLVLRPHLLSFPLQMLPLAPPATAAELITGRVCVVLNPV